MTLSLTAARPTAIVRAKDVPIPSSFAKEMGLPSDAHLQVTVPRLGQILFSPYLPDSNSLRVFKLPPGKLLLGSGVLEAAGINPGDVVAFQALPEAGVLLTKIEGRRDRAFTDPLTDELGKPIPPGWLAQAFTGVPEPEQFIRGGRRAAELIIDWARDAGLPPQSIDTILDFGSGCGRVSRHIPDLTSARVIGCDLHEDAIDWCQTHYTEGTYIVGSLNPPLAIQDHSIDLIYAISVFTHLDADYQRTWLQEWARIIKKGGLAIVTFNGDDFVEKHLPPESDYKNYVISSWQSDQGFAFVKDGGWEGVFPDEYQTTYQTFDNLRRTWAEFFELLAVKESGEFANRQNCAILRRR